MVQKITLQRKKIPTAVELSGILIVVFLFLFFLKWKLINSIEMMIKWGECL